MIDYNLEYERYVGHHDTGDWLDGKRKKIKEEHEATVLDTKRGSMLLHDDNDSHKEGYTMANEARFGTPEYYKQEVSKALARAKVINERTGKLLATHGAVDSDHLYMLTELMKKMGSLGSSIAFNRGELDDKRIDEELA